MPAWFLDYFLITLISIGLKKIKKKQLTEKLLSIIEGSSFAILTNEV